jgi:hypothetical protein
VAVAVVKDRRLDLTLPPATQRVESRPRGCPSVTETTGEPGGFGLWSAGLRAEDSNVPPIGTHQRAVHRAPPSEPGGCDVEVMARATRRRRPGRWTLVSGICLISVGVLSFNAYASFSATQSYNQSVTTGTMTLALANEDSATIAYNLSGSNIAPGDTMQRGLKLTFGGTVAASSMTLSAADSSQTALDDGTANGLEIIVEACSQAWDETVNGGIPTYACAGTTTTVMSNRMVSNLISTPASNLTTGLNLAGANHLRVTWSLPAAAGNTFQNLSNTISLTFTSAQRAAQAK